MNVALLSYFRPHHPKNEDGFTLIEMAIVMIIIGLIISMLATVMPTLIRTSKVKKARTDLETVDLALRGYLTANGKLPLAANGTANGDIPSSSLLLATPNDLWGRPIKYSVNVALTTTTFTDLQTTLNTACSGAAPPQVSPATAMAYVIFTTGRNLVEDGGTNNPSGGIYDSPTRVICDNPTTCSPYYDDLMMARSCYELSALQGFGSGSASGTGGGGENTYAYGCTNTTDDDGDGYTDCADQDCFADAACSGSGNVTITTTTLPAGDVNAAYSTVLQATGGTTPYEWTLLSNGGFSMLTLGQYTGSLSGNLDQCPGTYAITAQVQDSTAATTGGPFTDSASLAIQVTSNLTLTRTSGAGTAITWSSSDQMETFQTSNVYLGTINWSLNSGGASGYSAVSTGANTCEIRKSGTLTGATYTFILNATDSSCAANAAAMTLTVTETAGATGTISALTDSLEYSTSDATDPVIVHITGDIYAIAYTGNGDDGIIQTITIDSNGTIAQTGNALTFDNSVGFTPDIIYVGGDIYAIAYTGPDTDSIFSPYDAGWIKTVSINSSGVITNTGSSLEFDTSKGVEPEIIHIGGDIYAIAYTGPDNGNWFNPDDVGWIKTVSINSSGLITSTGEALEYATPDATTPSMINVSGDVYAIAYTGNGNDGIIQTVTIDSNGAITNTGYNTYTFDASTARAPEIIHISGDVYAVAYSDNQDDGNIRTITINSSGEISGTGNSMEFDTYGVTPDIIQIAGDVYAIAYTGWINNNRRNGWVKTLTISSDGTIGAVINTLEFSSTNGRTPDIIHISGATYAVVYTGDDSDGYIATFTIQ